MKKNFLLVLSSILFSIGLLVGCTEGEPGFEEEQPGNYMEGETDPTETDVDVTEDGENFDDEMDEEEEDEEV
jgi:hypothetical protein